LKKSVREALAYFSSVVTVAERMGTQLSVQDFVEVFAEGDPKVGQELLENLFSLGLTDVLLLEYISTAVWK